MKITLEALKAHALATTFFRQTTLQRAMERLKFVQADPIRAPARAQDLILRHRVNGYAAGDLEQRYPKLALEEDLLYAYGFMPAATWRLLHPRMESGLSAAEEQVLKLVSAQNHLHPAELEKHLGQQRELNAWGGYSKQTTRILQALHYRGLIRVAGRQNGVRLYAATRQEHESLDADERLKKLILLIAGILAPIPERSLRATLQHLRHAAPMLEGRHSALTELIRSGELTSADLGGFRYLWPAGRLNRRKPEVVVRFLSPFDPLVWDRRRFEHFWGWAYRFEAYTPAAKRERGYYAMPLLWRDDVVGWVNITKREEKLIVKSGFARSEPKGKDFRTAFTEEVARFEAFLGGRTD
jgi:uncharacterized protein